MPSEFELIARHFAGPTPGAVLGPGDDCALLQPSPGMELAVTTDMLVAGVHFLPDTDPEGLGWKTLAVNLFRPRRHGRQAPLGAAAGSLPEADEAWLAAFAKGFFTLARASKVDVVGGDTTRGPLNLCVTALGEVAPGQALRRDGAKAGDDLWVSASPAWRPRVWPSCRARLNCPGPWCSAASPPCSGPGPALPWAWPWCSGSWPAPPSTFPTACWPTWVTSPIAPGWSCRLNVGQLPLLPKGVDPLLAQRCPAGRRRRLRTGLHRSGGKTHGPGGPGRRPGIAPVAHTATPPKVPG